LVVEDESAIAELIVMNLRHDGHEVLVAADALAGQSAIDGVLPDLVILDWMLPGVSGVQLAQRWRRDARTRDLPILMLTARSEDRDIVEGLDAGADDYLTKPLLDRVWGDHVFIEERTVDVHVKRLRDALAEVQCAGMVETVRGAGYRLARPVFTRA
jgi:DNA-binding response OmpR family regulator